MVVRSKLLLAYNKAKFNLYTAEIEKNKITKRYTGVCLAKKLACAKKQIPIQEANLVKYQKN